jgi:hypothetical protein
VLARNTGTWHRWNPDRVSLVTHLHAPDHQDAPPKARPKVELDEQQLRLDFEEVEQLHFAVRERFEGERYFGLSYEDLASDPDAIGRQLLAFLRLDPFKLNAAVSKLEQRPLTESISNYDDLSAAFSETPWARFFES